MANPYCFDGKRIRVGYRVAFVRDDGQLGVGRVEEHQAPFSPYKLSDGSYRWGSEMVVLEEPVWPNK